LGARFESGDIKDTSPARRAFGRYFEAFLSGLFS
jgi:hypothetical protein